MLNMHLSIQLMAIWQIVVFVCAEIASALFFLKIVIINIHWRPIYTHYKIAVFVKNIFALCAFIVLTYFWIEIIF